MAAITNSGRIRYITPVGYEVNVVGTATEALTAGTPVIQAAGGWSKAPALVTDFHGVAAQDYYAGETGCTFVKDGEFDGFTALVPGEALHISATVAGGWDTTAPTDGIVRARAVSATRIRVLCV